MRPLSVGRSDYAQPDKKAIPDDYGKGRRCSVCNAFVCRYNPDEICWHHQPQGEGILIDTGLGLKRFPLSELLTSRAERRVRLG